MNCKIINMLQKDKDFGIDVLALLISSSNQIEGNSLDYRQTSAILSNPDTFIINNTPAREIYEVKNLMNAYVFMLEEINNNDKLNANIIIECNNYINENVVLYHGKGYRKLPVIIANTTVKTTDPFLIPEKIDNLLEYYEEQFSEKIDFTELAKFHVEFEKIHPFIDGNGRTGRMLINWYLLKHDLAPTYVDINQREKYYEYLDKEDYENLGKMFEDNQQIIMEKINNRRLYYDLVNPEIIDNMFHD